MAANNDSNPVSVRNPAGEEDTDDDVFQNADSTAQLALVLGDLQNTLRDQSRVLASPVRGASVRLEPLPEDKAIMDVVKGKMKPINVKAADMVQELAAFFRPIEAYFKLAGKSNMSNRLHDERRVILLESVMGEDCYRAMSGLPTETRATFQAYKKTIEERYSVIHDQVHLRKLLRHATMTADKSTRDFVN